MRGGYFSKKNASKYLQIPNFVLPLQSQSANGALVQLVRIRACHARGQGFESPTHRKYFCNSRRFFLRIVFFCVHIEKTSGDSILSLFLL